MSGPAAPLRPRPRRRPRSRPSSADLGPGAALRRAGRPLAGAATFAVLLAVFLAALVGGSRAARVWLGIGSRATLWRDLAVVEGEVLYVALGDSTAQGLGSRSPASSYVGLLAEDLRRRSGGRAVRVVNLSVTGARVADVVRDQVPALRGVLADGVRPLSATVRDEVAVRHALRQVQLEAGTRRLRWGAYAGDFFHPSDAGYRVYAAAFLDARPGPDRAAHA